MGYTTYQHPQHNKRLEDPPIIILHGLLGSKSNWASMAKGLLNKTKNRRVSKHKYYTILVVEIGSDPLGIIGRKIVQSKLCENKIALSLKTYGKD